MANDILPISFACLICWLGVQVVFRNFPANELFGYQNMDGSKKRPLFHDITKRPIQIRFIAIAAIVIILTSGFLFSFFIGPSHSIFPGTEPSAKTAIFARVFFTKIFPEPLNETLVSFGVVANGSSAPYTFEAIWGDNFSQTNAYGTFSRTFVQGQGIPSFATIVVTSANNESKILTVDFPQETSPVSITSSEALSSVEFIESGLSPNMSWSVQINGTEKSSQSNSILFPDLKNGRYYFTVSYAFNGSLDTVFNDSPR